MKLWAMPCRATQDGRVMVESSDKMCLLKKGMANHFSIPALKTPWTAWKCKKIGHWKMNSPGRLVPRKNEEMEPKQHRHPPVDMTGDGSKVWYYKEQYCIGTWNVRSMNQGKLEVVKPGMARVNNDILGTSELKWTGMGGFNSDDHYIFYHGQESLRRNGIAIIVNKRVWNAVRGCNLKNDRMTSVRFKANHSISQ